MPSVFRIDWVDIGESCSGLLSWSTTDQPNVADTCAVEEACDAYVSNFCFEDFSKLPDLDKIYLIEAKVKKEVQNQTWTAASGAYYMSFPAATYGEVVEVWEDGAEYVKASSIASCQSTSQTFFYDFANERLYIHTSGSDAPGTLDGTAYKYCIVALFWVCLTNRQAADWRVIFAPQSASNEVYYLPFLEESSFPNVVQSVGEYHVGNVALQFGDLKFINDGWWYTALEQMIWHNAEIFVKVGAKGGTYRDFKTVIRGVVRNPWVSDEGAGFGVKDVRIPALKSIPQETFNEDTYPYMDPTYVDRPIPIPFGYCWGVIPVCIDVFNFTYKVSKFPIQSVEVYENDVQLVEEEEYTVDLERGEFTLLNDPGSNLITCDIEGIKCDLDTGEYSENFADGMWFLLNALHKRPSGQLGRYKYWKRIQLDLTHLDGDEPGFPLLVTFIWDTDIGAACRADGFDIRFVASDRATFLPYERESFSKAGSLASGVFWVKVDLRHAGTDIYLYYGNEDAKDGQNPAAVWSGDVCAYHLEDGTVGGVEGCLDSSGNAHHLTKLGTGEPLEVLGKINNGQSFDGTNDYLSAIIEELSIEPLVSFSVECWINPDTMSPSGGAAIVSKRSGAATPSGWELGLYWGDLIFGFVNIMGARYQILKSGSLTGGWHHIVATYDGSRHTDGLKLYIDGAVVTPTTIFGNGPILGGTGTGDVPFHISGWEKEGVSSDFYDGSIDEVRVSKTTRSAVYAKFAYHNQNSTDNELVWGGQSLNIIDTSILDRDSFRDLKMHRDFLKMGLYLDTVMQAADIIRLFQSSALFQLVPSTDGRWRVRRYQRGSDYALVVPSEDIRDMTVRYSTDGIYKTVIINFGKIAGTGEFYKCIGSVDKPEWLYGEDQTLEIETALYDADDALLLATLMLDMLSVPAKSVHGKIGAAGIDMNPADKISISKRIYDADGNELQVLDSEVFRLFELNKDIGTAEVRIVGIDDIRSSSDS